MAILSNSAGGWHVLDNATFATTYYVTCATTAATSSNIVIYRDAPALNIAGNNFVDNSYIPAPAFTDEQRATWEREQQEAAARKAQADARAEELFLELLAAEQKAEHEREGRVTVRSITTARSYRVRTRKEHGRHGNIEELDERGEVVASLCCAPRGDIPHYDAILGQLLALQHDEDAFRRAANFTPRRPRNRRAA